MAFEIPKVNMFQPAPKVSFGGGQGTQGVGGVQGGFGGVSGASQGGSAVDRELADMKRFIQPQNRTGELQPNNAEEGARLKMLYA